MELTIDRKSLQSALTRVLGAVPANPSQDVFRLVLLEADGLGSLRLTGQGPEWGIEAVIPAVGTAGESCLPGRFLGEVVGALTDESVSLRVDDRRQAWISEVGRPGFRVPALAGSDYPALPEGGGESAVLGAGLLAGMLRRVQWAASDDTTRPLYTGVSWTLDAGVLSMAATDTHRVAVISQEIEAGVAWRAVVPGDASEELGKLLAGESGEVRVAFSAAQMTAEGKDWRFVSNLIDGQFPRLTRVWEHPKTLELSVESGALETLLRRVQIVGSRAQNKNRSVWAVREASLHIEAEDSAAGRAEGEIAATVSGTGTTWGLNGKNVLDLLAALDCERLQIALSTPLEPVIFRPETASEGQTILAALLPVNLGESA